VAADCLRALFGVKFDEGGELDVQNYVATLLLAEALRDLRFIRGALTRKD
jgi:hypothetical protein